MNQSNAAIPSRALTIAQLVVSLVGILFSIGGLLPIIILRSSGRSEINTQDAAQLLNFQFVILLVILLAIPAVVSAIRSLAGLKARQPLRYRFLIATLLFLLVLGLIWMDAPLVSNPGVDWLNSLINIFSILIPIWWFLELGRARLSGGNTKRQWGVYSFSTFLTLPTILVVEVVVLGFGVFFGVLWLIQQPEFAPYLVQLSSSSGVNPADWENLMLDLLPLLSRPGVIAALAASVALVIPLIEEMLKPLAIWLLHKRNLTPVEGFTVGLVCGASFALLESLFSISAVLPDERLYVITGRLGTGLLHIFTAGINGWALAATWRDGKYWRVAIAYGTSVLIHGVWNLFALLMGLHMAGDAFPSIVDPAWSQASVWVLTGITIFLLLGLIGFNLYLRRSSTPPPLPPLLESGLG
jgi:uncharacterized Tic20 family protein